MACIEMEVPMLAPSMTGTAWMRFISPALMKPTSMTVVALLCTSVPSNVPSPMPDSLRVVMTDRTPRSFWPAASRRPSVMMFMPKMNRARPPRIWNTRKKTPARVQLDQIGRHETDGFYDVLSRLGADELEETFDGRIDGFRAGVEPDGLHVGIDAFLDGDLVRRDAVDRQGMQSGMGDQIHFDIADGVGPGGNGLDEFLVAGEPLGVGGIGLVVHRQLPETQMGSAGGVAYQDFDRAIWPANLLPVRRLSDENVPDGFIRQVFQRIFRVHDQGHAVIAGNGGFEFDVLGPGHPLLGFVERAGGNRDIAGIVQQVGDARRGSQAGQFDFGFGILRLECGNQGSAQFFAERI